MINGSFVFGMDDDGPDVFRRTVDFALESGITAASAPQDDRIEQLEQQIQSLTDRLDELTRRVDDLGL